MTSKADRLLAQLDDTEAAHLVGKLGELPNDAVNMVVAALRAARKAGRSDESAARAQRRADRQANRKDDDKIVYAAESMVKSLARRSAYTLETLAALRQHYDDGPVIMAIAVDGARAQGYSDAEIGRALGVTSEAIGQRYGRRSAAPADRSQTSRSA